MKKFRYLTVILIALTTLLSCQSAEPDQEQQSDLFSLDNIEESSKTPENLIERPEIPEGVNYEGYEFEVLRPESYIGNNLDDEVYAEQETGETMNDAIYRRNAVVESLLNIRIRSVTANAGTSELADYARRIIQSGDDAFDAIIGANWTHISLFQSRMLENLYNVPTIDLAKPWWDQRAVEELSYRRSQLYYISGDINYFDKYGIMVLYFNKRLFAEHGLEQPYDKVRNGTWTVDAFAELTKDFSRDLNGDGQMDEDDLWAITENTGAVYHFLIGCGEKTVALDNDGVPAINTLSERHIQVVDALSSIFSDTGNALLAGSRQLRHISNPWDDGIFKVFRNGRSLMFAEMIGTIPNFRDMEDDFGFLPLPKFNEAQTQYHSFTSYGWATSYSIPVTNKNLERTGMILEVMAGYSSDTIIPALIDVSLKSKFARDEDSGEMLQIIFDTKTYDLGIDYSWGGLYGVYEDAVQNGFSNFVSSMERQLPRAEADMERVIDIFEELS